MYTDCIVIFHVPFLKLHMFNNCDHIQVSTRICTGFKFSKAVKLRFKSHIKYAKLACSISTPSFYSNFEIL